ncbi:hypothetical protein Pcinc_005853, partial [Petrolisthes cinctipes]
MAERQNHIRTTQKSIISKVKVVTVSSSKVASVTARHPVGVVVVEAGREVQPVFLPGCILPCVLPQDISPTNEDTHSNVIQRQNNVHAHKFGQPQDVRSQTVAQPKDTFSQPYIQPQDNIRTRSYDQPHNIHCQPISQSQDTISQPYTKPKDNILRPIIVQTQDEVSQPKVQPPNVRSQKSTQPRDTHHFPLVHPKVIGPPDDKIREGVRKRGKASGVTAFISPDERIREGESKRQQANSMIEFTGPERYVLVSGRKYETSDSTTSVEGQRVDPSMGAERYVLVSGSAYETSDSSSGEGMGIDPSLSSCDQTSSTQSDQNLPHREPVNGDPKVPKFNSNMEMEKERNYGLVRGPVVIPSSKLRLVENGEGKGSSDVQGSVGSFEVERNGGSSEVERSSGSSEIQGSSTSTDNSEIRGGIYGTSETKGSTCSSNNNSSEMQKSVSSSEQQNLESVEETSSNSDRIYDRGSGTYGVITARRGSLRVRGISHVSTSSVKCGNEKIKERSTSERQQVGKRGMVGRGKIENRGTGGRGKIEERVITGRGKTGERSTRRIEKIDHTPTRATRGRQRTPLTAVRCGRVCGRQRPAISRAAVCQSTTGLRKKGGLSVI